MLVQRRMQARVPDRIIIAATRTFAVIVACNWTLGCSSGQGHQSPSEIDAQAQSEIEAAVQRAAGATSLYSFQYYFGSRVLYVQLPAYDPTVTCASLAASQGKGYTDMWFLELYVDWSTPQSATSIGVTYPPLSDSGTVNGYLDIVHFDSVANRRWTVFALDGTVTFESAPSNESDQLAGVQARGHLNFTLPRQPLSLSSCSGSASVEDGGSEMETCTCLDVQGNQSNCVPLGSANCCEQQTSDIESFSLDFLANACGLFCSTTPGDPNDCGALLGAT